MILPARTRGARRPAPRLALALVLVGALVVPATASAQATRTWVSGVGDDANPCSRTAPCKTFAGAISKTAAGGEIDALDPGGYGSVTITKSITIAGTGTNASILSSGVNGVVIQASPTDHVTLQNLAIDGAGSGTNGVRILSAASVRLENVNIFGMSGNGVDFESNSASPAPQSRLAIENSTIEGNAGSGLLALPQTSQGERATILGSHVDGNGCGVSVDGTCGSTTGNGRAALVTMIGSTIDDNGTGAGASSAGAGIESVGSTAASIIGDDTILGNTTGLSRPSSGIIITFGDNYVYGNATNGTPSSAVTPKTAADENAVMRLLQRHAKAIARAKRRHHHRRHHHRRHHHRAGTRVSRPGAPTGLSGRSA